MRRAYGTILINSGGSRTDSPWCQRWEKVVQYSGNHYILPGGPTGRRYVDLLTDEVQHIGVGNHPSEQVLVFSSVILGECVEHCGVSLMSLVYSIMFTSLCNM